jgi:hypothetical protein
VSLILLSLQGEESDSTTAFIDSVLEEILKLCDCSVGSDKTSWLAASKASILAIASLYRQNCAIRPFLAPGQNTVLCDSFFELLGSSIGAIIKQSFAALQSTLDEGDVWKCYNSLYYQLCTVTSLVLRCIIPLSRHLLARVSEVASEVEALGCCTRGINTLIAACCASPPPSLTNASILRLKASLDSPLCTVLRGKLPAHCGCSETACYTAVEFSQISLSLQELFGMAMCMYDTHTAALQDTTAQSQVDFHCSGLVDCLNSAIKVVK